VWLLTAVNGVLRHFILAHGHAVDEREDAIQFGNIIAAIFFAAILADQNGGELIAIDGIPFSQDRSIGR
jgi:hypothetical protein